MRIGDIDRSLASRPNGESGVAARAHSLVNRHLEDVTPGDLAFCLRQGIAVSTVLRRAIHLLVAEPLVEAEFYPGDLLFAAIHADSKGWLTSAERAELRGICSAVVAARSPLSEDVLQHAEEMVRRHGASAAEPDRQASAATDIVIFDGVCNLCTHSIQFILRHEASAHFQFASLQSAAGARLLKTHGFSPEDARTFVLIADGQPYVKSEAAIRVAKRLKGPWKLARFAAAVPRPLRDWIYDVVARNRYRWFGRRDACMVPTPELRSRFLEQ